MLSSLVLALAPQLSLFEPLADINTTPVPIGSLLSVDAWASHEIPHMQPADGPDGRFYFGAYTVEHGYELWRSDGTGGGTELVTDVNPGPTGSDLQVIVAHAGKVYFAANTEPDGKQLWVTDGTPAGTQQLTQLNHKLTQEHLLNVAAGVGHGGDAFIPMEDYGEGMRIYRTDGTPAGTTVFFDNVPGFESVEADMSLGHSSDGTRFFFSAGDDLYSSDGTVAGTVQLSGAGTGVLTSRPIWMTSFKGSSYFAGRATGTLSESLWRTDGTPGGTVPAVSVNAWKGKSLEVTAEFGGELYGAYADGPGLWRTNGSTAGTSDVVAPGSQSGIYQVKEFAELGGELYFLTEGLVGFSPSGNDLCQLIATDGTSVGTRVVYNFPYIPNATATARDLVASGGRLVWSWGDGSVGRELWTTDGTTAGVTLLTDLNSGASGSDPRLLLENLNGWPLWAATETAVGRELFLSDGTASGTQMVFDIEPAVGSGDSAPWIVEPLSPTDLLIVANDGPEARAGFRYQANGQLNKFTSGGAFGPSIGMEIRELKAMWIGDRPLAIGQRVSGPTFITDGTAAGTESLGFGWTRAMPYSSTPYTLDAVSVGGRAILTGGTPYVTDGDVQTTAPFAGQWTDAAGTYTGPENICYITKLGDQAIFQGDSVPGGHYLWFSDGTLAGTQRVVPLGLNHVSQEFVRVGHEVVFRVDASNILDQPDFEFWATDGTVGGTRKVFGSNTVPLTSGVEFGGRFYFGQEISPSQTELWSTDLTPNGARFVTMLPSGSCIATTATHLIWQGGDSLQLMSVDTSGTVLTFETPFLGKPLEVATIGNRVYVVTYSNAIGVKRHFFSFDGEGNVEDYDLPDFSIKYQDFAPWYVIPQPNQPALFDGGVVVVASIPSKAGREVYKLQVAHATAQSFDAGTGAHLEVDAPVLGDVAEVRYSGAPVGSVQFVMTSPRVEQPLSLASMCAGCGLYINPDQTSFLSISPALEKSIGVFVPAVPALTGLALNLQVASVDFLGAPDLELSNAVEVFVGP